ncbi:Leishmanolysin-like peptidase [Halotydeus destructor]|nr:Leishmanolysin-like peptidase [Halotydeus destructor]
MLIVVLSLIVINTYHIQFSACHKICNHQPPRHDEVSRVYLEPHHVLSKRSIRTNEPLRIKVFYDESVKKLPADKFDVINNTVLPQALNYWRDALLVKPLQVPIRLSRKCPSNKAYFVDVGGELHQHCLSKCEPVTQCGEVVVPEDHLDKCRFCSKTGRDCRDDGNEPGEGVKGADFVFYVSAMQTERCNAGSTVAYAAHCQQEAMMDRPIAGHANLCPDSISTKPQDLETFLSTVKHEILHALGFSVSLYAFFRDKDGKPLTERNKNGKPVVEPAQFWGDNVIGSFSRPDWRIRSGLLKKNIRMVVTPRVVDEVRKHFNCSSLEGAELEDQGEDGTLLTHWEKRVFENEAMTGTHTQNPVYSRITLALMEDSGWYEANYTLAQQLKWGKNLGCDFAMKSCMEWMEIRRSKGESIHPFCDKVKRDPLETECTESRDAVALCNLMEYEKDLPAQYQNFQYIPGVKKAVGRYGGSVNLADYCPYIQEFTWKSQDIVVRGSQCQYPSNNPVTEKNFALELYGSNSKCFNHNNQMWEERTCMQVKQWQHWGSGCYEYSCKDGRLNLEIANHTFPCLYSGQEIKIQLYVNDWLHIGAVICPPCQELCTPLGADCRPDKVKSQNVLDKNYHKDFLTCSKAESLPSKFTICLLLFMLSHS